VKEEWDRKFQDECFTFEREWKKIQEESEKDQQQILHSELADSQRLKCEILADKLMDFNIYEMRYFSLALKRKIQAGTGINPLKLNMDWPSIKREGNGTWPPTNPNWFKQQEIMAKIGPFLGGGFGGGAPGEAAPQAGQKAAAAEPKVEEKKAEKSHVDIELTSFDAAQKIKLIKEVREIFKLGLKEAKDLVEGAPVWVKKEVKKEEADQIVTKLQSLGAKCKLA